MSFNAINNTQIQCDVVRKDLNMVRGARGFEPLVTALTARLQDFEAALEACKNWKTFVDQKWQARLEAKSDAERAASAVHGVSDRSTWDSLNEELKFKQHLFAVRDHEYQQAAARGFPWPESAAVAHREARDRAEGTIRVHTQWALSGFGNISTGVRTPPNNDEEAMWEEFFSARALAAYPAAARARENGLTAARPIEALRDVLRLRAIVRAPGLARFEEANPAPVSNEGDKHPNQSPLIEDAP